MLPSNAAQHKHFLAIFAVEGYVVCSRRLCCGVEASYGLAQQREREKKHFDESISTKGNPGLFQKEMFNLQIKKSSVSKDSLWGDIFNGLMHL